MAIRMSDHRWEWRLPSGVVVEALVDAGERTESVLVGGRVVSQAARGAKPEGHALSEPSGVVVTFQSGALICILRLDGEEISPAAWPIRKRKDRPRPRVVSMPNGLVLAAILAALAAGAALVALRSRGDGAGEAGALRGVFRADNGRFLAHYPPGFSARPAVLPPSMSGVVLEDEPRGDAVVLLALASGDVPRDPWLVQKTLHGEALANLPHGAAPHAETGRSDETCLGEPGAVVRGRIENARGEPADVWACAFSHEGAAYMAMTAVRARATSEEAAHVRAVVDATELTTLSQMGGREP